MVSQDNYSYSLLLQTVRKSWFYFNNSVWSSQTELVIIWVSLQTIIFSPTSNGSFQQVAEAPHQQTHVLQLGLGIAWLVIRLSVILQVYPVHQDLRVHKASVVKRVVWELKENQAQLVNQAYQV